MQAVSLSHIDEPMLLKRLADGSEAAFTELYHYFFKRVIYFARRFVPETDAQDIAAEAFIQLWKKKTDFQSIKEVSSFLFITARNRCYDLVKYHQVRQGHEGELIALMDNSDTYDFFWEELRMELLQQIRAEVNKLPERMREVFLLSFDDGLKPAQIAEKLNISVKTVSNQKLSAIKLLKTVMERHPEGAVLFALLQVYLFE